MSERERVQNELADFIREAKWSNGRPIYDAPYGVLCDFHPVGGGGYLRTVTFGCRRTLDAVAYIARPTEIKVVGHGPLAPYVEGEYGSLDEAKTALKRPAQRA